MKYMVWVNQKFLVTVETDGSACAAEHEILDNYQGIVSAQALDWDGLKTDTFAGAVLSSETISLNELKAMSDRYEKAWRILAVAKDAEEGLRSEIEQLQDIIERKKAELSSKHFATRKAHLEAINAQNAMSGNEQ